MIRVIVIFLMFVFIVSNAQFTKGDKYLGGNLHLNLSDYRPNAFSSSESRSLSVSPAMGFLVSEKLAIGGNIGFGFTKQTSHYTTLIANPDGGYSEIDLSSESLNRFYSAGAFAQRYFTISDKFLFSLSANLSFSRGHSSSPYFNGITGEYVNSKTNTYGIGAGIGPSLLFFPSANWGISAGLGSLYYSYYYNMTSERSSNSFSLTYGSFGLGFNYYFRSAGIK